MKPYLLSLGTERRIGFVYSLPGVRPLAPLAIALVGTLACARRPSAAAPHTA